MTTFHMIKDKNFLYALGDIADESKHICLGGKVRLKDGTGPVMIVQGRIEGSTVPIVCAWGEPDNIRQAAISAACLEVVRENDTIEESIYLACPYCPSREQRVLSMFPREKWAALYAWWAKHVAECASTGTERVAPRASEIEPVTDGSNEGQR